MAVGDQAGGSGPEITGGPFFGRFTTEERRTRFGLKIAWDVVHLAEAVSNNHAGCVCRFECRFHYPCRDRGGRARPTRSCMYWDLRKRTKYGREKTGAAVLRQGGEVTLWVSLAVRGSHSK